MKACPLPSLIPFIASAVIGFAVPAAAEENLSWGGWSSDGSASLFYGLAESDHVLLSLACESRDSPILLAVPYESADAKDGAAYPLTLSVGSDALTVDTTGSRMEMDDLFILVGELPNGSDIKSLLTGTGMLKVAIGTEVTELPLDSIGKAAQEFLAVCSP